MRQRPKRDAGEQPDGGADALGSGGCEEVAHPGMGRGVSAGSEEQQPVRALEDADYASLLERFEGDAELVADLVDLFIEGLPGQIHLLGAAIAAGDAKQVERFAHTAKGSVSNFAAHSAVEIAQKLETAARDGDLSHAKTTFERLKQELERVAAELLQLVPGQ